MPLAHAQSVVAVRVWPARDYTRVTLELDQPLKFSHRVMSDPPRLVVDLEGIEVDATLRDLVAKVQPDDPYIKLVRVGQYQPQLMRLVFDLKTTVAPQLFTLPPIAQYKHRLVIDLFPTQAIDPNHDLNAHTVAKKANQAASQAAAQAGPARATGGGSAQASAGEPGDDDAIAALIRRGDPSAAASGRAVAAADEATVAGAAPSATAPTATSSSTNPKSSASSPSTPNARTAAATTGSTTSASRVLSAGGLRPKASMSQVRAVDNRIALLASRKPIVDRLVTVAIDPGHGGEDPGAIGRAGTREKDVVLAIGKLLRERVNLEPNMRAYMTRDADFFVPLHVRVAKARQVKADLFISLHADAWVKPNARGASVFVLSERGASSSAARWLARQENRADLIGGTNIKHRDRDVARMLLDMNTAELIKDSNRLARSVLTELNDVADLHKVDVEQAAFAVLKAPDIPSILVETAFISNPDEEKRLASARYQQKVAEAMFKGIRRYFSKNPPRNRSGTRT